MQVVIEFPDKYKDRVEGAFLALSQSENTVIGRYGGYHLVFPKKNGQTVSEYLKECITVAIKSIVEFSEESLEKKRYEDEVKLIKEPKKPTIPPDILEVQ